MADFVPPAVRAFLAYEAALREKHGPLTLYVRPQTAAAPRAPRGGLVVGGWAFLDGEPAVMPDGLDILALTWTDADDDVITLPREPAAVLQMLQPYVTWHTEPCPHFAVTVPEDERPSLRARLETLPNHDGVSAPARRVLFPLLKEPGWAHRDLVVHLRLLERADSPLITFAQDTPKGYLFLTRQDAPHADARALLAEAVANLSARPFDIASISPGVAASAGSDLSADRLVDPRFLDSLHGALGPDVWVAVPHRVALYALAANAAADAVASFLGIVRFELEHGPADGHATVSSLAFRVTAGLITDACALDALAERVRGPTDFIPGR